MTDFYCDTDETIEQWCQQWGGHWGEHPTYLLNDWIHAVDSLDTRLGYWEWVEVQIKQAGDQ